MHHIAAAYGALTKAENRDPTNRLRADLVGLEGSHTLAGYKGSTRNFNPKFLRLEPGFRNQGRNRGRNQGRKSCVLSVTTP